MIEYEISLKDQMEKCNVAYNLRSGLIRYFVNGIIPGDFLKACLENNLKEALGVASTQHWDYIFNVVSFLYYHAPVNSWGSKEKVQEWSAMVRRSLEVKNDNNSR